MKKAFLKRWMLILATLFFFAGAYAQTKPVPSGEKQINFKEGQQSFKIKMVDDKIIELYVDDKLIPKENYSQYEKTIQKIVTRLKKDEKMAELDMQRARKEENQAKIEEEQLIIDKQKAEEDSRRAQKYKKEAEEINRQKFMQDQSQAKVEQQQAKIIKLQAREDAEQAQKYKVQVEELEQQKATQYMEQSKMSQLQAKNKSMEAAIAAKNAEEDRRLLQDIFSDIVKEKITATEKEISAFTLTEDEFIVNGRKQPESLHNKFKASYLKKKGSKINYHSSGKLSTTDDNDENRK